MAETPPEPVPADDPEKPEGDENSGAGLPVPLKQEIVEQLGEFVEPEKVEAAAAAVVSVIEASFHVGPLPPPQQLAHYDHVLPGAAERIVGMAERNQEHRHTQEALVVKRGLGFQDRGQWFALGGLVLTLGTVIAMTGLGHATAAASFGGAVTVGVVAVFLGQRFIQKHSDSESKEDDDD
jgi:uncharacterized membrane protein